MSTLLAEPPAPPPEPDDPNAVTGSAPPVDPAIVAYRRAFRRRLLLWSLLPVVVVILLALKLLSMPAFAALAQGAYGAKEYERGVAAADGLSIVDVFEPWVSHFDRGTALAQIGVLVDSRAELERALSLVPADHVGAACMVRTDLALVVEQQGDSAMLDGAAGKASAFYAQALDLIAAAPSGCLDTPDSPDDPPTKKPLDDEKARLEQKQQQAGGAQGQGGGQGDGGQNGGGQGGGGQDGNGQGGDGRGGDDQGDGQNGSSGNDPLDRLQQQNGEGQRQQQQNNDRNRYFDENPKQYDGKPW